MKTNLIKIRRGYDKFILAALNAGSVRNVPVNAGLYLSKQVKQDKQLNEIIKVTPVRKNEFSVSLGSVAFKPVGNSGRYVYFKSLNKKWKNLI